MNSFNTPSNGPSLKNKTHFVTSGPASAQNTVVFIHAFPLNHKMWEAQTSALSAQTRTIAYDLSGFGQSAANEGGCTIEFFVDDLILLLDSLQLNKVVVCGLSMGGYVALRALERHPERFGGLVLCDTRSEADSDAAKIKRSQAIKDLTEKGIEAFANGFVQNACSAKTREQNPKLIAQIQNWITANSPQSLSASLIAMAARTDTTASLANIKVPTLILVGEDDTITPLAASVSMQEKISQAALQIIPQAGHLSALENPTAFNQHLLQFINKL